MRFVQRVLATIAISCCAPVTVLHAQPSVAPSVAELPVPNFPRAKLYRLSDAVNRPVLVILPGAEGGDGAGRRFGPVLARLGYAAISLPYYSPNWGDFGPAPEYPDLPGSFIDIRIEQIAELRAALQTIANVDTEHFGLFAGSKGAEFALIAASRYAWIKAVVAYAPSNLVWEGWGLEMLEAEGTRSSFSLDGRALPFMPDRGFVAGLQAGPAADLLAIHENGRADHPDREAAARIRVEDIRGAVMLVAGDEDKLWASGRMARAIVSTRRASGLNTEALIYPQAGHDLAGGSAEPRQDARGGGTPESNAAARADAWPQVVAFLRQHLTPQPVTP